MKQDIRDFFKNETIAGSKLPEQHRIQFKEKLATFNSKLQQKRKKKQFMVLTILLIILIIPSFFIFKKTNQPMLSAEVLKGKGITSLEKYSIKTPKKIRTRVFLPKKKIIYQSNYTESNNPINLFNPEKLIKKDTFLIAKKQTKKVIDSSKENKMIKVDAKALLYSINHNGEEMLAYYKENNSSRRELLANLEEEIINNNLNIDPKNLLIDIEAGIQKRRFKEKLKVVIKEQLRKIKFAIANN